MKTLWFLVLLLIQVAYVMHRTLTSLCDRRNNHYTTYKQDGYALPVFTGGERRIWGLSAIILHQIFTILAPGIYTHIFPQPRKPDKKSKR